jgi:hypothetical protein
MLISNDYTEGDIELIKDLVKYAETKGLTKVSIKKTVHSTNGIFYYGNNNYICEINHIDKSELNKELNRCKSWVDNFVDTLILIRKREAQLPIFIRAYIFVRRFFDPGYYYEKTVSVPYKAKRFNFSDLNFIKIKNLEFEEQYKKYKQATVDYFGIKYLVIKVEDIYKVFEQTPTGYEEINNTELFLKVLESGKELLK